MSTVYVVQERMRKTELGNTPVHDLTPAAKYGRLEVILPPGQVAIMPAQMVNQLRHALRGFTDDDYLLAVGDPAAIAAAACVAAQYNRGRFKLLKWDKRLNGYLEVQINTLGD